MSETVTSATAKARSACLPVLKNRQACDLAVAVAKVTISDRAGVEKETENSVYIFPSSHGDLHFWYRQKAGRG